MNSFLEFFAFLNETANWIGTWEFAGEMWDAFEGANVWAIVKYKVIAVGVGLTGDSTCSVCWSR